jgi:type II secretory pathway pseudopilin PulG
VRQDGSGWIREMRQKNPFAHRTRSAFTLMELLFVVGIILALIVLLMPIVGMLKESTRHQQAIRVIGQLEAGLNEYALEDPTRSLPPQDPDNLVRMDSTQQSWHLIDAMIAMHADGGLQTLMPDPGNPHFRILIDPWKRPYRYQLDNAGASNPAQTVAPTRPSTLYPNWNSHNLVPYGYVWSLGKPMHGSSGQLSDDPDANPNSGAPWIYPATAPVQTGT